MTDQPEIPKEHAYAAAMSELVMDQRFARFMDAIKADCEVAIYDSITDGVAGSERLSLVAKGEIRAYKSMLSRYEDFLARQQI